jgi:uncharacterized protein (TIGR02452 family)
MRGIRAKQAADTLDIINKASYINSKGQTVNLDIVKCNNEALLYKPTDTVHLSPNATQYDTEIEFQSATTLEAARSLANPNVVALNFASAKNPGGGFLKGSQAQEESLARSSALYSTLTQKQVSQFYLKNAETKDCLYTDHIIYSPNVPVFKHDNGDLLDDVYYCSFITAPAVNAKHASKRVTNQSIITDTMLKRAEKVIKIALHHGHDSIVLGAWGTGVFGNSILDVAQMFRKLLISGKYEKCFKKVVFAIPDEHTMTEFKQYFSLHNPTPTPLKENKTTRQPKTHTKDQRKTNRWQKSNFGGGEY